ncbi:MAG: glycosyltransferase family 2 protein [Syntrophorhabdaceae bacterium]|nr:glycosyltransferase family 2 protein [Syntrophorhabdaceae bacterium]MDD5244780.1 glycosyltransferase family 2 protein [Syntrophorhabdaceae bacterium]
MNSTNSINTTNPTNLKDILSIVIITRDTKELLQQLLHSIKKDGSLKPSVKETVIIDNASADGTGDMVHNEFPWAAYVRNDKNMGFAASANQGINQSTGEYVLLLNSDTILIEGEIVKMLEFMEKNDDVGICGPQLVYPDMRPQRSFASIPSLLTEILPFRRKQSGVRGQGSGVRGQRPEVSRQQTDSSSQQSAIYNPKSEISPPPPASGHEQSAIDNLKSEISPPPSAPSSQQTASSNRQSEISPPPPASSHEQSAIYNPKSEISSPPSALDVPSLIGAAIMIRRSLFQELSGFDEQFFFFLEETDLCVRAKQQSVVSRQSSADSDQASAASHEQSAICNLKSEISSLTPNALLLTPYRVVLLPDVKVIHLQGRTVGKNWIKGRIEYNISLYKFIKKHHSALYYRSFQAVRFLKSIIVILVLSLLPFLLISKSIRRRYVYYWKVLIWHLASCPPTAGLRTTA